MSAQFAPGWRLRVASATYRFRESLFLLPALIVALGGALVVAGGWADAALADQQQVPLTLQMSSHAATWLLSTVAGATITTAGVVFSLTVVSLQLASSQFSPRVMRSFIRDRLSQVVIGMLVATFVYCVLLLPRISGDPYQPAPRVAMTIAVVLTIVTVVLIVAHLDHLAHRLQVGHVVRVIEEEGVGVIERGPVNEHVRGLVAIDDWETAPGDATEIRCPADGWVSQLDVPALMASVPPGTAVQLETRVGAYIHQGEVLFRVWPDPGQDVCAELVEGVSIADGRTMQQDVDFAMRQLVDIGLRALSAAINDPSTAVEVTLRLGSLLRRLLVTPLPPTVIATGDGRRLIRRWDLDHDEYIAHAFDQLRHVAPSQPMVAAAMLRVLRMLVSHVRAAGEPQHVAALERQSMMLMDALEEADLHPLDLQRLRNLAAGTDPAEHTGGAARTAPPGSA